MKSISAASSGFVSPPRLACAPRLSISRRKLAVRWLLSRSSPPMQTAASKAWPEAEDDGGKRAVLFNERLRNNSWTAGTGESRSWVSAASRFSCRMIKSVNGWALPAGGWALPAKRFFTRASSPQARAAGFCCARLVIVSPSRSQPGNSARRAACMSIRAVPNFCSPARVRPSSSNIGPLRPACSRTPASTARRCMGTSRPQASSARPRMAQIENHNHRIVAISPENFLVAVRLCPDGHRSSKNAAKPARPTGHLLVSQ